MPWMPADFKDKRVWAEVDGGGALVSQGGRTPIRYSDKPGAKVYRGGTARVTLVEGAPAVALDEGVAPGPSKGKGDNLASGPLPAGSAVAYTDGACRGNPGPAGSGVLLMLPDGRVAEATRSLGRATNNIAELTAIEMALDLLDEAELPAEAPVRVNTDSSYSIGVLAKGWKAKKNVALIAGIRARLATRPGVQLAWVKGHAGDPGNERADGLAVEAARGATWKRWVDSKV